MHLVSKDLTACLGVAFLLSWGCSQPSALTDETPRNQPAAIPQAATPTDTGSDGLELLAYFDGDWRCGIHHYANRIEGASDLEAEFHFTRNENDRRIEVRLSAAGTGVQHWSFDTNAGVFTSEGFVGTGETSAREILTSPGWQGDAIVWTGKYDSQPIKAELRQSYTKVSPTQFDSLREIKDGSEWTPTVRIRCQR